jgi:hypothetical protein
MHGRSVHRQDDGRSVSDLGTSWGKKGDVILLLPVLSSEALEFL